MKDIPIAFIDDETLYESENYVNFKLQEKDKEIESLQETLRTKTRLHRKRKAKLIKLRKEITNKQKRLELLNSIIKEVREYIEEAFKENEGNVYYSFYEEIYQILDKVEENK